MIYKYRGKPLYFITKSFDGNIENESILILSPEFYWVRNVSLNVKYIYEAKKMAQSVFDGFLFSGVFEYKIYKVSAKKFIFIAYDLNCIKKELMNMGINLLSIDKIYLAQNHINSTENPIRIDDKMAMVMQDKVFIPIPLKCVKYDEVVRIGHVLPKKLDNDYIYSKSFNYIKINKKVYNFIILLLSMVSLILMINIFNIAKQKYEIRKVKNSIIKTYRLPHTSFERKSILSELIKTNSTQVKIRQLLDYLGKFKFMRYEHYVSIVFVGSHFDVKVNLKDLNRKRDFERYISKRYNIGNPQINGNDYSYRINL